MQLCNKQYNTAMEIENHLSSYDHHHKKVTAAACIYQQPLALCLRTGTEALLLLLLPLLCISGGDLLGPPALCPCSC